jgi:hypothetical protein
VFVLVLAVHIRPLASLSTDCVFKLQQKEFIQKHPPATGSEGLRAVSRLQAPHSHLRYAHKTHYQIVFEEKGITINCIESLAEVMTVLSETVSGASLSDVIYTWILTLLPCSFTTFAKVGVGAPRHECRKYIVVWWSNQAS